jgi:hypothetical protein
VGEDTESARIRTEMSSSFAPHVNCVIIIIFVRTDNDRRTIRHVNALELFTVNNRACCVKTKHTIQ